jgi:uncharacterized RDD family membrane protein YckC
MQSKIKKDMNTADQTSPSHPTFHEKPGMIYGGFWIRFCAKMLDWIICSILIAVLPLSNLENSDVIIVSNHSNLFSFMMIQWLIPALYTTIFLVNYQATPGKMAFSLKVIPANQKDLNYGIALARFFCEMLSAFFLFIGYILAIFDIKKRTLHDRICKTYVVQTTQVVYHDSTHLDHSEAVVNHFHTEPHIQYNNIYGIHTLLFCIMILESLFSAAYCFMEDPLFRMVTWILNCLIGLFLMIALFKQRYPNFSSSIRKATWIICLYYCVITPIIYFVIFLIGIEHFLHNMPLVMDDPIIFMMQFILSITNFFVLFSWPQLLISVIFIPCTLVLGVWGIILVSAQKSSSSS